MTMGLSVMLSPMGRLLAVKTAIGGHIPEIMFPYRNMK